MDCSKMSVHEHRIWPWTDQDHNLNQKEAIFINSGIRNSETACTYVNRVHPDCPVEPSFHWTMESCLRSPTWIGKPICTDVEHIQIGIFFGHHVDGKDQEMVPSYLANHVRYELGKPKPKQGIRFFLAGVHLASLEVFQVSGQAWNSWMDWLHAPQYSVGHRCCWCCCCLKITIIVPHRQCPLLLEALRCEHDDDYLGREKRPRGERRERKKGAASRSLIHIFSSSSLSLFWIAIPHRPVLVLHYILDPQQCT